MALTLTTSEILLDIIQSFKKQIPGIKSMGTDFRAERLKLNQTYIAHITGLPSVQNYDAAQGGYKNGAASARGLLTDVPIVVNQHKHVPLKWNHLDNIKDNAVLYTALIQNASYVLAKAVIDDLLSGVTPANFSQAASFAAVDCDLDMITAANGSMNKKGALTNGRVMLVGTDVATTLGNDSRIASRDYAGQQTGGNALRRFTNVGGFSEIFEYPDMPLNAQTALTAVTGTAATDLLSKTAHGLNEGDLVIITFGAGYTGLTSGNTYFVKYIDANTFKVALTPGGTAIDITADGTGATVSQGNLAAFGFDPRAFALLAGIPADFNSAIAAQLGIPNSMGFESITDPDSGITMAAVSWQEQGTGDLYWSPTLVWGKSLGKQGATAAGSLCDYAGFRIVTP